METIWRERLPERLCACDTWTHDQSVSDEVVSCNTPVIREVMNILMPMKRYHWSVEYFEDLRNVNHCEYITMRQNADSGKYVLESQLRTWSELRRQRRAEEARNNPTRRNTLSAFLSQTLDKSPNIQPHQWDGSAEKSKHGEQKLAQHLQLPPSAGVSKLDQKEADDHALASQEPQPSAIVDGSADKVHPSPEQQQSGLPIRSVPTYLDSSHEGSGTDTPHEMPSDDDGEYFDPPSSMAQAMRKAPQRKPTPEDIERWANESGMGAGKDADALGDEPTPDQESSEDVSYERRVKDRLEEAEREDKSLRGSVY